jgi:hypothetical protein
MDVGMVLSTPALAYTLGVLWYDVVPGMLPGQVCRVAAYPFLGIYVAAALLPPILPFDPVFGGIHVLTAAIGSLAAVIVAWAVTRATPVDGVEARATGHLIRAADDARPFAPLVGRLRSAGYSDSQWADGTRYTTPPERWQAPRPDVLIGADISLRARTTKDPDIAA